MEVLKNIFTNPWTITIIGGIVVALVIERIFGKKKMEKVGLLSKRKGLTVIGSKLSGPDGGMKDEGVDTTVIDSEVIATGSRK